MRSLLAALGVLTALACCISRQYVSACQGRTYLNSSYGVITDGVGNYREASHCEWLIEAPHNNRYITLDFVSMETECAYDYLFIYDGNSYKSPLLGSFSGATLPDRVLATSGQMLIYFFSDRNYVRLGFHANFSCTECPHNCSGHGACNTIAHTCSCWSGYYGDACQLERCPSDCSTNGQCNATRGCVCEPGYYGADCDFSTLPPRLEIGGWSTLYRTGTGFTARTGHAGVFLPSTQCLYIFGGTTLVATLDDLLRYCLSGENSNKWQTLDLGTPWPSARHGHAIALYKESFYLYGGIDAEGVYSDQLWFYDAHTSVWTLVVINSAQHPTGLASHSLTPVDDWLYLLGGQSQEEEFVGDMYRINMMSPTHWTKIVPVGGKRSSQRLTGHSAVYHPQSKSILIFGGFTHDYARFPKRTNHLHAFQVEEEYWSQIHYVLSDSQDPPLERAFHSASIIGNYMVIVGGNAHIHHQAEVCFDGDVYFYHLGCHRWLLRKTLEKPFLGSSASPGAPKGRFSHVAAVVNGNTILVAGGYRGNVLGDLMAYTVPDTVQPSLDPKDNDDRCEKFYSNAMCVLDPECVWCRYSLSCVHRTQAKRCASGLDPGDCPGICAALHDCGSCTVHGPLSNSSALWVKDKCAWCVKEQQCQRTSELRGACGSEIQMVDGWWVNSSTDVSTNTGGLLSSLGQCRPYDIPAGLHLIQYRYPPNFTNPDEVTVIRETRLNFKFSNVCEAEVILGGEYTVQFRGFLHPLGVPAYNSVPDLQVYISMSGGQASLNISTDHTVEKQEVVASLNAATYLNQEALRADRSPIFPHEGRGHKYYISQVGVQKIAGSGMAQVSSALRDEWNAEISAGQKKSRELLTSGFLEPFHGNACDSYISCLACLTDTDCGWCPTSATCEHRTATNLDQHHCGIVDDAQLLVFNQTYCPVCSDHLECLGCTQDALCEWLTLEARCMRRGRFPEALTDPQSCPSPCSMRTNCSWCIADENECAWCEHTQTCFPFMGYILRHNYGGCTHWVDSMSSQQCHDCARHTTCQECLHEYQCGWCAHTENPLVGRCLHGDFTGPDIGDNCSALVAEVTDPTVMKPADWSYAVCPDVEECRLGYHNCHDNATCINTFESFLCQCNRGFQGDGRSVCDPTCYHDCHHGDCSGFPDYQCICHLGWTGLDCNTNCGCNNHSYCETAVGQCDICLDHTRGEHCEMCDFGSYGNATNAVGCMPCPCNGHADPSKGLCSNTTGLCHCRDNTEGDQCDKCKQGYYGDPRNNGKCYLRCEGRTIVGNITKGYLGTHAGMGTTDPEHAYCLWILTVYDSVDSVRMLDVMPTITFTMETDIKTWCSKDFVYVFDGIPSFTSADPSSWAPVLATYCGYGMLAPRSVEATSGYLTVYYEANIQGNAGTTGFNASYHVNSCPSFCHGNRRCHGSHCDCLDGYSGIDCQEEICPGNCGEQQGQGQCDLEIGYCDCHYGYGGISCNKTITTDSAVYLPLNDPWRRDGIGAFSSSRAHLGHTLVTCDQQNLYMFGGLSFTPSHSSTGRLWRYNIMTDIWEVITATSSDNPTNRYFHAAVCVPSLHAMFVFGGLVTESSGKVRATNEAWRFNLDSYRWTRLQTPAINGIMVPAMAGHTLTQIDPTKVLLIGGFSTTEYFSDTVYQLNTADLVWERIRFSGVKPTGVYGHSTVFHSASNTLYLFGGYEYQTDRTVSSSNLYALDLRKERWSIIPSSYGNKPAERFWHTAIAMDDYMVVIGGGTSDADFDGSVWAYRYSCNHWINISPRAIGVLGSGHMAVRGAAAIRINNRVYHVGGYDGLMHATLTRIQLPFDLCTLNSDPSTCDGMLGCNRCSVKETNETYCYDNSGSRPAGCLIQNTTIIIQKGPSCDKDLVNGRACSHHKNCRECLARWPAHEDHHDVCKWCSNCPTGACVRIEADCDRATSCELRQLVIRSAMNCQEHHCQASDCDKCWHQGVCMWTRQFKRSSEVSSTLSLTPIFDWNCVKKSLRNATEQQYDIESSPPSACPRRCTQFPTCSECLASPGAEGGWHECYWSVTMQECLSPAYRALRCTSGSCGHIESGPPSRCPQPCNVHTQCDTCLRAPGCGWCAFGGLNGLGICMEGGLTAPLQGSCIVGNITQASGELTDSQRHGLRHFTAAPTWSFTRCPPENECLNGHHTCDENQDCTDLPKRYQCDCKTGFRTDNRSGLCRPFCRDGCEPFGVCIHPDVCQCHFGFVGHNCTVECLCNKHSDCYSVTERDRCLACQNNTMGDQCVLCKPLYVGNPVNGGSCRSCTDVCHRHSSVCLSEQDLNRTVVFRALPVDIQNVTRWVHSGAKSESKAWCMHCANNTTGRHCEQCKPGYYRLKSQPITDACTLCQCHGHSDMCDKATGTDCDCKNNTQSPRCDTSIAEKECHLKQCSECLDNFLGTPTKGHQCYRQINVDRDYCFDPTTQSNCYREPAALHRGRTVFFAVQPKYLNVNIRVTIDVKDGGINLFLANLEDAFTVVQDKTSGVHIVHLDPSVHVADLQHILDLPRQKRSTLHFSTKRFRRDDDEDSHAEDEEIDNGNQTYAVKLVDARGINTFVTLDNNSEILAVRNLENRLVITLPSHIHELKKTRFFVIIQAVGSSSSNETHGMMFFRQDQLHIDLFVFFSVFFSSFFLFLDLCVLVWKIKQAVDTQRSRHRRQVEMECMASRPFGKSLIITNDQEYPQPLPETQGLLTARKTSNHRMSMPKMGSKYSLGTTNMAFNRNADDNRVNPLALEPMDDCIAAIGTFFFELPGGKNAPVGACLGSTLLTMRVMYPGTHHTSTHGKSGHHCSPSNTL